MAATDALPLPKKNTLYRVYFPLDDPPGTPLGSDTGLDSERSLDGAAMADCTNEATFTDASFFYLELTAAEMNTSNTCVQIKNSGGTVLLRFTVAPFDLADLDHAYPADVRYVDGAGASQQIQDQCTTALALIHLNHLMAAAVTGSDVVDDSVIAKLVSKSATADWDDFVNTTDALQALADALTTIDTVADAIKAVTDLLIAARAEPSGVPAANEVWLTKLDYLFATLRNRLAVTASEKTLYDDSDAAMWKKTITSTPGATGTYNEGEAESP